MLFVFNLDLSSNIYDSISLFVKGRDHNNQNCAKISKGKYRNQIHSDSKLKVLHILHSFVENSSSKVSLVFHHIQNLLSILLQLWNLSKQKYSLCSWPSIIQGQILRSCFPIELDQLKFSGPLYTLLVFPLTSCIAGSISGICYVPGDNETCKNTFLDLI